MPPELFELCMLHDGANPTGKMIYDQTIDVWGLGIVGCMLVTGVHPLRGLSTWQQFLDAMQAGDPRGMWGVGCGEGGIPSLLSDAYAYAYAAPPLAARCATACLPA